jgi:ABC-type lipoprotein release transport system permease subunit
MLNGSMRGVPVTVERSCIIYSSTPATSTQAVEIVAVTILVLPIACANVAGLLLACGSSRRREIAALAMVGLYGVVSYAVTRRTPEIGISLALGAPRAAVVHLILCDGIVLVGLGLLAGVGVALIVTRPLAVFLAAELPSRDPLSFAGSAILLLVTSLIASWSPARSATEVAPATALRAE